MIDFDQALRAVVDAQGSDLHLKVGLPAIARVNGELVALGAAGGATLEPQDTLGVLHQLLEERNRMAEFEAQHEVELSYELQGVARFRINAFRQRDGVALAARVIPYRIPTIDELNLPPVIATLADEVRGIVLVTGTTGSGKSTTLAAMINQINQTRAAHILTIEDPIEFVHRNNRSIIGQREVGADARSFHGALRHILRQDPDVILIGEMRDEETVSTALSAAETGHLVLSTIHTIDAAESINRMLDFFPARQHALIRSMLAGTMRGVISQRLVPATGGGRVAACEVLRMTGRVREMILDPERTAVLGSVIADGEYYGMQTFDQSLHAHVVAGRIAEEDALMLASSPTDLQLMFDTEGRRGTTMHDVPQKAA
ncbi:MAG TPA: PilT/PilU family type 4a pilus ATPase [Solirubrobacteraceae bacterium]